MAEASRVLQTTLLPTFHPQHKIHIFQSLPLTFRRNPVQCSVSTTVCAKATVAQKIPWGYDIDSLENASALQKWLTESGLPPQKMAIQKVEVGERGLVALKNIRKGEKLLFVPPSLFITADSEWTCGEASEALKRNGVPDWPLLATYLISEASYLESSRWSNYISALPRQPYSLLYLTREELDRYLEASQIRQRAIERVTNVVGTYNDLRIRIFSKHPALFPEEVFNIETFKWSFGILFSRLVVGHDNAIVNVFQYLQNGVKSYAVSGVVMTMIWLLIEVRLPSLGGKVALVPWADMLNHRCKVGAFLDYDKSSQGVVFSTDEAYEPGFHFLWKEINRELFLSYGFVPREGTNPRDSVEVTVSLSKSDKCYKEKLEVLRKHGLSAPPSMSGQFEEMAAAASNKSTTKKDLRYSEIEEEALQFILDTCEASISKYNKFLQASGSMDLDVTSPKQLKRRLFLKQLAVDLSTSERRILFRAQYILRRRLRDIRSGELKALTIFNGFRKFFK